jgi:hypothetical protein
LMADAFDLRHRLPELWQLICVGDVPSWRVGKLRPKVMLHIHISEEALLSYHNGKPGIAGGACRLEGVGPLTLGQVRRFLADTGCEVKVQPVIDPQNTPAVDSYEIPRRIREAMFLRMPASCCPYATATQRMDLDHTIAYRSPARGGPPGQTGVHSLGPLIRFEHRGKTHGRWRVRQPEPGVWIWRSPHHVHYLVTKRGDLQSRRWTVRAPNLARRSAGQRAYRPHSIRPHP